MESAMLGFAVAGLRPGRLGRSGCTHNRLQLAGGTRAATSSTRRVRTLRAQADLSIVDDETALEAVPLRMRDGFKYGKMRIERPLPARQRLDKTLLYLPGIDGTGLGILKQADLLQDYDLHSLVVPREDRSDWDTTVDFVIAAIEKLQETRNSKTVLVAESMGAVLALQVLMHPDAERLIERAVLVNPATSYSESAGLQSFWPNTANLPDAAYRLLPLVAFPLLVDPMRVLRSPAKTVESARRVLRLTDILPKDTFSFRLELLRTSKPRVNNDKLRTIKVPTTVVASSNDALVPSFRESSRLVGLIPNAVRYSVKGGGHSLLQSPELCNIGDILRHSVDLKIAPSHVTKKTDEELEAMITASGIEDAQSVLRRTNALKAVVSPVFVGQDRIPSDRPILFVSNHTLYGMADLPLFIDHYLRSRGVLVRGLAHPWLFAENDGKTIANSLQLAGAVKVSPRNIYRLLNEGSSVLLFPGGAREAYKRKNEKYELFWPERSEFVRMAIRTNAVVVPLGSVGVEDAFEIIADGNDVLKIPIVGDRVRERLENLPMGSSNPRKWITDKEAGTDVTDMVSPISQFKGVRRQYFGFGEPLDAGALWSEEKERLASENPDYDERAAEREFGTTLYARAKCDLEEVIRRLLEAREMDPFEPAGKRLAFESLMRTKAPTTWAWESSDGHAWEEQA